ncbi:hypothetical protein BDF14DRAFT_1799777 [Spinellus fusiger]|nr:hypothetical protein BDF14DRAFT_1799777 [Spinellus fusiger]
MSTEPTTSLESRILRAAATTTTDLPEFPDDKSDLPSDYEYDPDTMEEEEEEEIIDIDENDLLEYLDQQESPLTIAQRLFYHELNTVESQSHAREWSLQCLEPATMEALYSHGWAIVDGLLDLDTVKGARLEAEAMLAQGVFSSPSAAVTNKEEADPFRDTKARDDTIVWLDPTQNTSPHIAKILAFIHGPLHHDMAEMIRLHGSTEYQLAYYHPQNAQYEQHRDAFPVDDPSDQQQRRVTAIVYLNPVWASGDGGELKLLAPAEAHGVRLGADTIVPPLLGRVVLFMSGVVDHAVLQANKERFALTAWMR